jgi:hypothetical protein
MFRKRRSLGLAFLAFGTALSLCTIAAQGWAQHEIVTELVGAGGSPWSVCGSACTTIVSTAWGYDANWQQVSGCAAEDSQGSTAATTCPVNAVNLVGRLDEFNCCSSSCVLNTVNASFGSWANGAVIGGTINVSQGGACSSRHFTAEAAGYN